MKSEMHYQMFETYYKKAVEAEAAGHMAEAKDMYLRASESLLKAAKNADGNMKTALMNRADNLSQLSDAIVVPKKKDITTSDKNRNDRQGSAVRDSSSDESETVWKSSGKPNVKFDDIAGLDDVKETLKRKGLNLICNIDDKQLVPQREKGGILLYGPPGTGKTMLAKALANYVGAELYLAYVDRLIGKYFGDVQRNVRMLFEIALKAKSAVLFFDDFDTLGHKCDARSTAINTLITELLCQMDKFSISKHNNLLILAATNRPWVINSEFLRPSRLTEKIYVGLPDHDARAFFIYRAFKDVPIDEQIDLGNIVLATDGYNAHDVLEICSLVKDRAVKRTIDTQQTSTITELDFLEVLKLYHSSVQKEDIKKIRSWEQSMNE